MLHERIGEDVALVVDLDRTLIAGDVAVEALVRVARRGFSAIWGLVLMLFAGRAAMKSHLARHAPVNPASLPYCPQVLELIHEARRNRRRATATCLGLR